jgi:formate dehydrogenase maturation protein FdhE
MKTEEAISEIEAMQAECSSEALMMAIAAMKKQIPTRVIRENWTISKCPCCGTELGEWLEDGYHKDYEHLKVCNCGQHLDWSYPPDEDDD